MEINRAHHMLFSRRIANFYQNAIKQHIENSLGVSSRSENFPNSLKGEKRNLLKLE